MKKQGLQKRMPQWFAYECPCTRGMLVLHKFKCVGFATGTLEIGEDINVPTEFMGIILTCERCGQEKNRKIPTDDDNLSWFLDHLTPNVTHDPELRDKILWYWDDNESMDPAS